MMPLNSAALVLPAVVYALTAAVSGWIGYRIGADEVEALRAAHARSLFAASEHAHRQLLDATARGDALTRRLALATTADNKTTQDKHREVSAVTSGRACLGDPALRLLDGAPGLSVRMPAAASGAATASGQHVATDTQLAAWALDAGAQYADCARRLSALIAWHDRPAGATP